MVSPGLPFSEQEVGRMESWREILGRMTPEGYRRSVSLKTAWMRVCDDISCAPLLKWKEELTSFE